MNTYNQVALMIEQWKGQGLSKPEFVVNLAEACIGWPYVFGGRGETCTPAHRKARASDKYPTIVSKCQVLNGSKESCNGCKWYPGNVVLFFDCRGFTYWVMLRAAGITIKGAGATSQYNDDSNWDVKGPISQMPLDKVCCVFRYDSGTKKYEHTLLYDGRGNYIHCSGEVKKVAMSKYKATHYAIPKGLYESGGDVPVPTEGTAIVNGVRVALRVGPTTAATIIQRVDNGKTVQLTDPPEEWVHVTYNGKEGYMMKKFLKMG